MSEYAGLSAERAEVAYYMRRLYMKDLTSCTGGNISMRTGTGRVLITPASLDKGELKEDEILLFSPEGDNLTPNKNIRATIELGMHLSIYQARPDVMAVVHAHPVFATSFSCIDAGIETALTPEAGMVLGKTAAVGYFPAGSAELAAATAESLRDADVTVMRNHGATTVGPAMFKAYSRLEMLENCAKMTWIAATMARSRP